MLFSNQNYSYSPLSKCHLPHIIDINKATNAVQWSEQSFSEELSSTTTRSWGIFSKIDSPQRQNHLIGFIFYKVVMDHADLLCIAVDPRWQKKGLGRNLLKESINQLKTTGVVQLFLEARSKNHTAIQFYTSCGFEPYGKRENYYSDPSDDALLMRNLVS